MHNSNILALATTLLSDPACFDDDRSFDSGGGGGDDGPLRLPCAAGPPRRLYAIQVVQPAPPVPCAAARGKVSDTRGARLTSPARSQIASVSRGEKDGGLSGARCGHRSEGTRPSPPPPARAPPPSQGLPTGSRRLKHTDVLDHIFATDRIRTVDEVCASLSLSLFLFLSLSLSLCVCVFVRVCVCVCVYVCV